jgi:hypothetical protein
MTNYATLQNYNIDYDEISEEFYITSKQDDRQMIGSFETAADAIEFAEIRVKQTGEELQHDPR